MIYTKLIIPLAISLFLAPAAHCATADDVLAANSALITQTENTDIAVVAITAATPPTTAQEVPTALESLTNAISAAHASLTPTTPSADPATEENVVRSWGSLADQVENLMVDYVDQRPYLIDTFGLESAIHTQLVTFNSTFLDYAAFMLTVVTDASSQALIAMNTRAAVGTLNNPNDGITEAFQYYP